MEEQIKMIKKGAVEVINEEELRKKLERSIRLNKPLTIKLGLDPTAPDIHLGHAVVLRKIKQLQDFGHKAVIIIGDFTAMIGDPTGKSKTRKQLSKEEVLINAQTYKNQLLKILDENKTRVCFNSEWLEKLTFREILHMTSKHTVARMLEREDFKNRFTNNQPLGIHEFFYPLMQGFDSVHLKADIEIGGTDQRFNILMGRTMQAQEGQEAQIALFMEILEGTDGKAKMSKSLGNYIGVNERPEDIFGKVMSIPDELIVKYFELATDVPPDIIEEYKAKLESNIINPKEVKMLLAYEITRLYHNEEEAQKAQAQFISIFQKRGLPESIPELICHTDESLISIVKRVGGVSSNSEVRRLIKQGGVQINGVKIDEGMETQIKNGDVIKVGKKNFARIVV